MIIRNLWLFLSTVSFIACIGYSKTHNIGNPNLICNRTVLPPCNGSIKPNPVLLSAANGLESASHLEADMEWRRIKKSWAKEILMRRSLSARNASSDGARPIIDNMNKA